MPTNFYPKKDITVIDTGSYILIKIPKDKKKPQGKRPSLTDRAGVLEDIPELKGKTSVEVQHMISEIWAQNTVKNHRSS